MKNEPLEFFVLINKGGGGVHYCDKAKLKEKTNQEGEINTQTHSFIDFRLWKPTVLACQRPPCGGGQSGLTKSNNKKQSSRKVPSEECRAVFFQALQAAAPHQAIRNALRKKKNVPKKCPPNWKRDRRGTHRRPRCSETGPKEPKGGGGERRVCENHSERGGWWFSSQFAGTPLESLRVTAFLR